MDDRERLVQALEWQRLGTEPSSPLYCRLIDGTIADVESGGPCAALLADRAADPASAFVLAFLGGVHRLVLEGRAPELAAFYPSVGGHYDEHADPVPAFLDVVAEHLPDLEAALRRPVQTNEVGRCPALLPGFLAVTAMTGLPLRTLEIGASAGLNLRWDRYRYEGGAGGSAFGDVASPLRFDDSYRDPCPDLNGSVTVAERRGCDRSPIDPTTDDGRLTLRSFVWPDQVSRHAALTAAIEVAHRVPVVVDRADAAGWVNDQLAEPTHGVATVVYHSIVWQYLTEEAKTAVETAIVEAGARATGDAPVAWLRFEPAEDPMQGAEVHLRVWPGGGERLLIRAGYHGKPVRAATS